MASAAPLPKPVTWVTAIDEERPMTGKDPSQYPPCTVGDTLARAAASWPDSPMLVPADPSEATLTISGFSYTTRGTARAMLAAGLGRFDGVAILGFNAIPWHTAAVGGILAGGVVAGMYPTNSPPVCAHILTDVRVRLAFVDSLGAVEKLVEARRIASESPESSGPGLTKIVSWGVPASELNAPKFADARDVMTT